MNKATLINYLDSFLKVEEFAQIDSSKNGLQVDSANSTIARVGYAVDCTDYIIDQAVLEGVDMLIVHHGLFRGVEQAIVGLHYDKIKKLLAHDIAVYCAHLPLDAHETVGNNHGLVEGWIEQFSTSDAMIEPFGAMDVSTIGFATTYKQGVPISKIRAFCDAFGLRDAFYNYGKHEFIHSVGIVTGKGNVDLLIEAKNNEIDLFITGELVHYESTYAKELQQSVLLGGHYETETVGVALLAQHLQKEFNLAIVNIDQGLAA